MPRKIRVPCDAPTITPELYETRIQQALQLYHDTIIEKPSVRWLATKFGVGRTTLRDRLNGAKPKHLAYQHLQVLTPEEEQELSIQIDQMWKWNFPCQRKQAISFANEILARRGQYMNRQVGRKWITQFLRRHPELQIKIARPVNQKRGLLQLSQVKEWMETFTKIQEEYSIQPCDTYNMDEKGVMLGMLGNISVLCTKTDIPTNLVHSGNRELSSIIECISADGHALPPLIIFKGKKQMKAWHEALPKGPDGKSIGVIGCSESGWTNNAIGYEWVVEFEAQSRKRQQGEYRQLIVDGHESHITIKTVQFCIENKIILTKLPPHSTHLLQLFDVGIFGPLAIYYRDGLQNLKYSYFNVDKVDFIEIYYAARTKALSEKNILHAWRDCGYFPFDPEVPCKTMIAKETYPPTSPNPQHQSPGRAVGTPYHNHQVDYYIRKATARGFLGYDDILKLAKATKVNKTKATMKEIQCNELMESKAQEARKRSRRKGDWGNDMVLNQDAIDRKKQKEAEKEWSELWRQFACPISQAQQIFKVTKRRKKVCLLIIIIEQ